MIKFVYNPTYHTLTVEYEGKEYYADKEDSYISCKGCVFDKVDVDYKWCACKDDKMKQDCYSAQIVWKEVSAPMLKKVQEEEPKFTVELDQMIFDLQKVKEQLSKQDLV